MRALTRSQSRLAAVIVAVAATVSAGTAIALSAQAATAGCTVAYSVPSQWSDGFTGNVSITNLGDPITSWTLTWSYTAGQQVTQAWNAATTQSGGQVTARNLSYNGSIAHNATPSFGVNGSGEKNSNPPPHRFPPQRAPPPRG